MKKLLVTGCSFTAGNGWQDCGADKLRSQGISQKDHPNLWINLCHNGIERLRRLQLINKGLGGASNAQIFENTIDGLVTHGADIDLVMVQWTSMPRYTWHLGLETWDTTETLTENFSRKHDHRLSDGTVYTRSYLRDFIDRLRTMHHLHWEILQLLKYADIIMRHCQNLGVECVFINGLCPWDQDYFVRQIDFEPIQLTQFTQVEILDIKNRTDPDIERLYKKIHDDYSQYPPRTASWINLYSSFLSRKIDVNFDGAHPGAASNRVFFEMVKEYFDQ